MTLRVHHIYRDTGEGISYRAGHEYVYDPRDLDKDGKPPRWFMPQAPFGLADGEVDFDHQLSEEELNRHFPNRSKYNAAQSKNEP